MKAPEHEEYSESVAKLVGSLNDKLQALLFALAAAERQTHPDQPLARASLAGILSIASSTAVAARDLAQAIATDHPQLFDLDALAGELMLQVSRAA
jgi:hypothetical protein